jgi:hypothetical protein
MKRPGTGLPRPRQRDLPWLALNIDRREKACAGCGTTIPAGDDRIVCECGGHRHDRMSCRIFHMAKCPLFGHRKP